MWYVLFLASVCALDLTSYANFKFYCVEWCKFWYWEEEYIDILLERNLVHVRALLASIEVVNKTSALVARLEARHETRSEEATSTSALKKKGGCQIEPPP